MAVVAARLDARAFAVPEAVDALAGRVFAAPEAVALAGRVFAAPEAVDDLAGRFFADFEVVDALAERVFAGLAVVRALADLAARFACDPSVRASPAAGAAATSVGRGCVSHTTAAPAMATGHSTTPATPSSPAPVYAATRRACGETIPTESRTPLTIPLTRSAPGTLSTAVVTLCTGCASVAWTGCCTFVSPESDAWELSVMVALSPWGRGDGRHAVVTSLIFQ
ncbi:hypothetical protein C5746_37915 [Streptomyces atratus]|uniref:Uncharacterized protein n=1 Tax=Streptomyces atratus TaxID=1893 RepID=A0A2Z5JNC7_STRAR|nr:hypothetical protein C5746_37915 [Streptomyces atratus]